MSLQQEIDQLRIKQRSETPAEILKELDKSVEDLKNDKFLQRAKRLGEKAPEFSLNDSKGTKINLSTLLKSGPVIINFYRGGWCPYCNLELNALQKNMSEFQKLGAQLIAISPEAPDNSLSTKERNNLEFMVLSDLRSEVAHKYGIVYKVPEYLKPVFAKFGLDLKVYNNSDEMELPIPATYVISEDQIIKYVFASEDFTSRADIPEIMKVLKNLKYIPSTV